MIDEQTTGEGDEAADVGDASGDGVDDQTRGDGQGQNGYSESDQYEYGDGESIKSTGGMSMNSSAGTN